VSVAGALSRRAGDAIRRYLRLATDSPPGTAIDQACWCVAMSIAYTARSVLTNTRLLAATMLRMNISPSGAGQLHWTLPDCSLAVQDWK